MTLTLAASGVEVWGGTERPDLSTDAVFSSISRAKNCRFWPLSALRTHTKAAYKMNFSRKPVLTGQVAEQIYLSSTRASIIMMMSVS